MARTVHWGTDPVLGPAAVDGDRMAVMGVRRASGEMASGGTIIMCGNPNFRWDATR